MITVLSVFKKFVWINYMQYTQFYFDLLQFMIKIYTQHIITSKNSRRYFNYKNLYS